MRNNKIYIYNFLLHILIVLTFVGCNKKPSFKFDPTNEEIIENLRFVEEFMLSHRGSQRTNYFWDVENHLSINNLKIGRLSGDKLIIEGEVVSRIPINDQFDNYVETLIELKKLGFKSAFKERNSNNIFFTYLPDKNYNTERDPKIIVTDQEINSVINTDIYSILEESPPLYLIRRK